MENELIDSIDKGDETSLITLLDRGKQLYFA